MPVRIKVTMIEIIIIGSGTCVPSLRRAGPAACVRSEGFTVLVDSAAGTLRQLLAAGIPYQSVDLILYTHRHPDHVAEFVPFVFATKYAPDFARSRPVQILAGEGFAQFHTALKAAFGEWVDPDPAMVRIEEIPCNMPAALQIPPFTIRTAPVEHTPASLAYRLDARSGGSVVFSGDTDYSETLIELARGADLFVCECAAPEGRKVKKHLMPSEAGRMAEAAGVSRLLLTHFYPACDESDLITPCSAHFRGPILLAEDLMRLSVP